MATPDAEPDTLADEPLGRRNAALLQLRLTCFGDHMRAYADCPQCGTRLELELWASALLETPLGVDTPVEVEGHRFRQPTTRDLAAVLGASANDAPLRLLRSCLVGGAETADEAVLEPLLDQAEAALERADPWVELRLDLRCDKCGHVWEAPFDIAAFLWEEWDAYAQGLLNEIHILARSYGWSEVAILSLSDSRRTAYLERALA